MTEDNGKKEALVKKTLEPKISGAVVVCEGGDNIQISEKVIRAVSTALGISSSKVCVEDKK